MLSGSVYALIQISAALLGAICAANMKPGPIFASALEHFAAGVVFAAAAGEILPDVIHGGSPGQQ